MKEFQVEAQGKILRRPHSGRLADSATAPSISSANPQKTTTSPTVRTITNFSNRSHPISKTQECPWGLRLGLVPSGLVLRSLEGMQSTKLWMHQASAQAIKATVNGVATAATIAATIVAVAVVVVTEMEVTTAGAANVVVSPSVPTGFLDR